MYTFRGLIPLAAIPFVACLLVVDVLPPLGTICPKVARISTIMALEVLRGLAEAAAIVVVPLVLILPIISLIIYFVP